MAIYNEYSYPADFDSQQRAMLDEAAAIYDFATDEDAFADTVTAIRDGDYFYVDGARDEYDIGYAQRDITGVDEALECFFDFAAFGEQIADSYEGGGFARFGWLGLAHK